VLRSVLTILRGSALAQLLGFLILPVLARSFEPEVFGHFQAYMAIMTMFIVVVMLRYEIAILRAKAGRELTQLLGLCCFLVIATTLLLSVAAISAQALGWPAFFVNLGFGWWWLSLAGLIIGWTQIFSYLATRDAAYGTIANSKVAQGLANSATSAGLAIAAPLGSGLILADIAGRIACGIWLARGRTHLLRSAFGIGLTDLKTSATRFKDLSTISLPGAILSTAGSVMTPLLIYMSFSASTAGQYGLVERAVGLPVALIVGAVSQVHMGNLSEDLRSPTGAARKNFLKLSMLLGGLAFVPVVLCVLYAQHLFHMVFGTGWDQAARFAQILAPAYFLVLVSGGINMTLTVMGRQKTQLAWDISRFASMAMLWLYAPSAAWPVDWIIIAHSTLLSVFSVVQLVLCYSALPKAQMSSLIVNTKS
jgi:teichuronic acid exporter